MFSAERSSCTQLPFIVPTVLDDDQLEQYLRILEIEELTQKIKQGQGEYLQERDQLVELAIEQDIKYQPPADYRRELKQKVYIPVQDFPDINFVGMIIGPKGQTLQKIESQATVKVFVRGRAVDLRISGNPDMVVDDDLHAVVAVVSNVEVDGLQRLQHGVQLVTDIIETACAFPEKTTEIKLNQLTELARLNDTSAGCMLCGDSSHGDAQCPHKNDPEYIQQAEQRAMQNNVDFNDFFASLGEDQSSDKQDIEIQQAPWNQLEEGEV